MAKRQQTFQRAARKRKAQRAIKRRAKLQNEPASERDAKSAQPSAPTEGERAGTDSE